MEKEKLLNVEKKFYEKLSELGNQKEKFSKFEKYFNWIKSIECPRDTTDETSKLCLQMEGRCIYNLVKWLSSTKMRAKDFTSNWNGALVKKVAKYVEYYEASVKTNLEPIQISKSASIINQVWAEKDFATKAYCWQLLQRADLKYKSFGIPTEKKVVLAETELVD